MISNTNKSMNTYFLGSSQVMQTIRSCWFGINVFFFFFFFFFSFVFFVQGLHLGENIQDAGPPIAYDTSIDEASNKWTRAYNIFSNRHDPSRTIAERYADMEGLNALLSGCILLSSSQRFITFDHTKESLYFPSKNKQTQKKNLKGKK